MKRRIEVMTIKERFEAVKNTGLRWKLLKNYDEGYAQKFSLIGEKSERDALQYGFVWADTTEGHDYWKRISFAMTNTTTLDEAYAKVYGAKVPDMPSIPPPPPKPAKGYRYHICKDNIVVTQSIDGHEWRATFDIDSFIAWVKENA
jgi:hypothetical protein